MPTDPARQRDLAREIRETTVPDGAAAIWWLGQSSVIAKAAGKVVGFDLYLTDYGCAEAGPRRAYEPVLAPERVDMADVIFCSHEHQDHLDPWTLGRIAKASAGTQFVVPQCCVNLALAAGVDRGRIHPSRTGHPMTVNGVEIMPIRAAHESFDLAELGHRWQGYIVMLGTLTVCHTGDTVMYEGLADDLRRHRVDLLLGPINGADYYRRRAGIIGNMGYRELAELAAESRVHMVIPLHYDLFSPNQEHPGYFVDYLYERFPTQPCKVMARGERFIYFP